jgi:hypothetical protein
MDGRQGDDFWRTHFKDTGQSFAVAQPRTGFVFVQKTMNPIFHKPNGESMKNFQVQPFLRRSGWGLHPLAVVLGLWLAGMCVTQAQWSTQSFKLVKGWNAIFLHVDASHAPIEDFLSGKPIDEVWLWNPPSSPTQFVNSVDEPVSDSSNWVSWTSSEPDLKSLVGSSAYLVKASEATDWDIKGRPVPLHVRWNTDGQNFVGFPVPSTATDLVFDNFLGLNPDLQFAVNEIFHYIGSDSGTIADSLISSNPLNLNVERNQAYWLDANGYYNEYFGPFKITLEDMNGVYFGDQLSQYRVRIRNITEKEINVTMALGASDTIPVLADFPVSNLLPSEVIDIQDIPPMLVRDAHNVDDDGNQLATYSYIDLKSTGSITRTLDPSSGENPEVEIVLGLNRSAMSGSAGDYFAGILNFKDDQGYSEVEIPVSAFVASQAGLWVGMAEVDRVRNNITFFERDDDGTVFNEDGTVNVTGVVDDYNGVPRGYSQRLILHVNDDEEARLMQRVYYGIDKDDPLSKILSNSQSSLDADQLGAARRVSSVHFPWSKENEGWVFEGSLNAVGADLDGTTTLELLELDSANDLPTDRTNTTVIALIDDAIHLLVFDGNGAVIVESDELLLQTYVNDFDAFDTLVRDGFDEQSAGTLSADKKLEILATAETLISQAQMVVTVDMNYGDQGTNPFLHTYHPDHDNRDADFDSVALPVGEESYDVDRTIALLFSVEDDDFDSLTGGSTTLSGNYAEEIQLTGKAVYDADGNVDHYETRNYGVQGSFTLRRISDIATLEIVND